MVLDWVAEGQILTGNVTPFQKGFGATKVESRNPESSGQMNSSGGPAFDNVFPFVSPEDDEINRVIKALTKDLLAVAGAKPFGQGGVRAPVRVVLSGDLLSFLGGHEQERPVTVVASPREEDLFLSVGLVAPPFEGGIGSMCTAAPEKQSFVPKHCS